MRLFLHLARTLFGVFLDVLIFFRLCLQPRAAVAAENLFLRKQLGLYVERKVKSRRATDEIPFTLARLSLCSAINPSFRNWLRVNGLVESSHGIV
jgi:hypothetical protein